MNAFRFGLMLVAAPIMAARRTTSPTAETGDTYEITNDRDSTSRGSNGSSGSTTDRDTIVERVLAVRDDGLELEFDLPANASED